MCHVTHGLGSCNQQVLQSVIILVVGLYRTAPVRILIIILSERGVVY